MSSPDPAQGDPFAESFEPHDDPMTGIQNEGSDEEGEGDVIKPGALSDDSSEEEEEDAEEEQRIRDGFIVDEDEDEDEEESKEERKRRKRRKRHHQRAEEVLEDDDLELLAENTGGSFKQHRRLTRLRRGRESDSPPATASSSKRRLVESSDEDLENDDGLPRVSDIHKIWDDDRGRDDDDDDVEEDMADFIETDDEDGEAAGMDEAEREERRRQKRKEEMERRKMANKAHPEWADIDANAWDEILEVFGDGHEYDWALQGDEDAQYDESTIKVDMKYQDVFEPSAIRNRMLTEDDDLIRAQDTPERMQLATSTLSPNATLSLHPPLTVDDLNGAARWICERISHRMTNDYFNIDGPREHLKTALVMAVTYVVKALFIEEFEVPLIWTHRRDSITHSDQTNQRVDLLTQGDLWRIHILGQKYRSLVERRRALAAAYERLGVSDQYYEGEISPKLDSAEIVSDTTEWLMMKYKDQKADDNNEFRFATDEQQDVPKHKMPSRVSAYEIQKKSIISRLAKGFGLEPTEIAQNFLFGKVHFPKDQDLGPSIYAEQFADPDPEKAQAPEELLSRARLILSTEMGKDPLLRAEMRKTFKTSALISVEPTERGILKIDENSYHYNFKYLLNKPIHEMIESAQFLHILSAENEHLVNVKITLSEDDKSRFERRLREAFSSDDFNESALAWNEERSRVVHETLESHLIPTGVKWVREYLREEVEDFLAAHYGNLLRERINVAPLRGTDMKFGETPCILAMSWGKGDPLKDAITVVVVDEEGRMREYTKLDNLVDPELRDEFIDLLQRRKPQVIVIAGFTVSTAKLSQRVKAIVSGKGSEEGGLDLNIPVRYVADEIARLYQHSRRAEEEFGALSVIGRYCVGLARYAQSPLTEYAALGSDICAITLEHDDIDQHLVPQEKLLVAFEQALVDVTNRVGVDINRTVSDPYYRLLLPFVCGLGPRKAGVVIRKIAGMGGTLVNRTQFIKSGILTTKIFMNAAAFLRIIQEPRSSKNQPRNDDDNAPDPLDDTRIHPEDYELARKMATDALELDEEDTHDFHPSHVVSEIMSDNDKVKKLMELNLDEFAVSLYEANKDKKRYTLDLIRDEMLDPFAEHRNPFRLPDNKSVFAMLSGESDRTLRRGHIVSVQVVRVSQGNVVVRLDSGIEGNINTDHNGNDHMPRLIKGQTLEVAILDLKTDLENDTFLVEVSARASDVAKGDAGFRQINHDESWNSPLEGKHQELQRRKKRAEVEKTRRVIKHPNFHNFNSAQAEAYLDKQPNGEVVIRPSSKGIDHLAVTWKVDNNLYQHIDVTEPGADPTGQRLGSQLIVDSNHTYADLDELIVNHVQAMARKVEDLKNHERFKRDEDELRLSLKNYLAANPSKSMYGFTLNRRKPGHFNLCFLANKNSSVQTWPVRVAPEAYFLFEASAVGVPELCDAFKVRHLHESQNIANAAAGGKTPYGAGRTPGRGNATPGHMSVRQGGRTPASRTPNAYGGATPSVNYTSKPALNGYQTPRQPPAMNPERAAMLSQHGSWGGR